MFRPLYYDVGSIVHGGLWVDLDAWDYVQVTDLDSAAGVDDTVMIEKGGAYINEKGIREGAQAMGLAEVEKPPEPPKGPKEWAPRWRPKPKPGHLFWIPEEPPVEGMMRAWSKFSESGWDWDALTDEERGQVLMAAEANFTYRGMDGVEERVLVIERGTESAKAKEEISEEWRAAETIVSKNVEKAIWKILKRMGVEKPE